MKSRDIVAFNIGFFCLSLVLFISSITSDLYVHYYEGSPVPPTLAGWWHILSVIGTIISAIFLIVDCCCCCRLHDKEFVEDREEQELWACTGHWVFLATLCKDLPLLILSCVILYWNNSDQYQLCKSDDMLSAIKHNSTISLAGSLFRLTRACIFDCDGVECLFFLHGLVCILSFVVFIIASNVCLIQAST